MTALQAALLSAAAALLVWPSTAAVVARRLRAPGIARHGVRRPGDLVGRQLPPVLRRRLLAAAAGTAAFLWFGGPGGLVVAAVLAAGVERLLRSAADEGRAARAVLAGDVPVVCDLLAVCLAAGIPLAAALQAVAGSVPGAAGAALGRVAAMYRLGAEGRQAWAGAPGELAALGRVLVRAGESGARAVPGLQALAADRRAARRSATETAVRRAGVWVLAPLGACFLPAFVCLGVLPLVLGIAAQVAP